MSIEIVPFGECEPHLNWREFIQAIVAGHRLPKAVLADTILQRNDDTLLTRNAWIDGLGIAVKSATIFPGNGSRDLPTVNGGVSVYSDADGMLEAILDFRLVTKWKTAGDSLLAAQKLARPQSRNILIVGAGTVAGSMVEAYSALFPDAEFSVWSRKSASARALCAAYPKLRVAGDLETAVWGADIVSCATMATEPLIHGDWLQPGQHIDLIGAYRPDMREADDLTLQRSRIFVDSKDTTVHHIGELMIPIQSGAISENDVVADFYDLGSGVFSRGSESEITVFKNGGGAHLDLMAARFILDAWQARK